MMRKTATTPPEMTAAAAAALVLLWASSSLTSASMALDDDNGREKKKTDYSCHFVLRVVYCKSIWFRLAHSDSTKEKRQLLIRILRHFVAEGRESDKHPIWEPFSLLSIE